MKRNMDLCRDLLMFIEKEDRLTTSKVKTVIEKGYELNEILYHCQLLQEHGYVREFEYKGALGRLTFLDFSGLTWEGHDFIDKIRENTVWNKTKDVITQKGLPMALEVVQQVATAVITSMTQAAIHGML